ncbi:MAG: thioredoxin family protein [Candidatus Adiutrix sp.]
MKLKIVSMLLALVLIVAAGNKNAQAQEIEFYSYNEAIELAKKDEKMVMLFFWTDWCYYCGLVREKILPDTRIQAILGESFVVVSINKDKSTALARKYRVNPVPTFVFLNSEGEPLGVLPGYLEPDNFLEVLVSLKSD